MRLLFFLLLTLACGVPGYAASTLEPYIEPTLANEHHHHIYTNSREENARRAVRLGYNNFRARRETQELTPSDVAIFNFVQTQLIPFLSELEVEGPENNPVFTQEDQETFSKLLIELSKLLCNNQQRYTNPLLLDNNAAMRETILIVQQAVEAGTF